MPALPCCVGGCRFLLSQEGATAEKYRDLHAKNNPNARTFIIGEPEECSWRKVDRVNPVNVRPPLGAIPSVGIDMTEPSWRTV